MERFLKRITTTLEKEDLAAYIELVEKYQKDHDIPPKKIAAAIAHLLQETAPFLYKEEKNDAKRPRDDGAKGRTKDSRRETRKGSRTDSKSLKPLDKGMDRYRVEVGYRDDVKPGHLVGAIANEAGLDGEYIGAIQIFDDHSLVDLPEGMPSDIFKLLQKTRIANKKLSLKRLDDAPTGRSKKAPPKNKRRKG